MSWISVGLAGACGALAALIAIGLVRNYKTKRGLYTLVFVISFVVLNAIAKAFILSPLKEWEDDRTIRAKLNEIRMYQLLEKHDLQTYEQIVLNMKTGLRLGESDVQITARVRDIMASIYDKYAAHASDQTLIGFVDTLVHQLTVLAKADGDACYRYLFPQQTGGIRMSEYFSAQQQAQDLNTIAKLVESAIETRAPIPTEAEVAEDLERIFAKLQAQHGERVLELQNPLAPDVDKAAVCALTISMYQTILDMPEINRGAVLRYLFSGTEQT